MSKANKIKADIVVTLGMAIFSTYVFLSASKFPKEAGVFPKIVSTIVIIFCVVQIILNTIALCNTSKATDGRDKANEKSTNKDFWITIATLLVYPALIFVIGYFLATLLYLAFAIYVYGYKNKLKLTLITLGVTAFLFLVFVVFLKINLPVGLLLGGF